MIQELDEHFDGLVQERRNSSALAMELHLSCTKPSICEISITYDFHHILQVIIKDFANQTKT